MKLCMRITALSLMAGLLLVSQCSADFWGEILKGRVPKGSDIAWEVAQQLMKRKPRVTSSIADAKTDVPMLDGFDPAGTPMRMSELPIGAGGSYVLDQPGFFSMKATSFSVSPGLSDPRSSEGYVYAPLRGPCSGVVRKIVKKYGGDPSTGQQKIQRLLWGISSLSNLGDLAPDLRSMAYDFLTEEEYKLVGSTGLGPVYDLVKNISSIQDSPIDFFDPASQVVDKLSEQARSVLQAEWRLRELLKDAGVTYSALESAAIGPERLKAEAASRDVPEGRWSYHPNGYFIRYLPADYTSVRVQVSLPRECTVERDALGRTTRISLDPNNRIDIAYGDQAETAGDGSGVKAYPFSSVTFARSLAIAPDMAIAQEIRADETGFALVGPTSKKKCDKWSPGKLQGLADRYHLAYESGSNIERVLKGAADLRPSGKQCIPSGSSQVVIDLADCILGLRSAAQSSVVKDTWAAGHLSLAYEALAEAFCRLAGDRTLKSEFDPTDGVAVPGDGASQCLMVSAVPASPFFMPTMALPESVLSQLTPEAIKQMEQMQQQMLQQMVEMQQTVPEERDANCRMVTQHLQILKSVRQAFADNPPTQGEDASSYTKRMEARIRESQGFSDCKLESSFGIRSEDCAPAMAADFGQGQPDIILTAAQAHAKSHEETCRSVRLQGGTMAQWLSDARNYQEAELKALDAQIASLDKWCMMNGCALSTQE